MWLAKYALTVLELNWFERFGGKKKNLEHFCSNVVHTTAKHMVSSRGMDENYNENVQKINERVQNYCFSLSNKQICDVLVAFVVT